MQTITQEEIKKNIEAFVLRFLELQQQKKNLDDDVKELKQEFKEEGVPVSVVVGVINDIKKAMKKNDSEIHERDTITAWLNQNSDVVQKLEQLNEK